MIIWLWVYVHTKFHPLFYTLNVLFLWYNVTYVLFCYINYNIINFHKFWFSNLCVKGEQTFAYTILVLVSILPNYSTNKKNCEGLQINFANSFNPLFPYPYVKSSFFKFYIDSDLRFKLASQWGYLNMSMCNRALIHYAYE